MECEYLDPMGALRKHFSQGSRAVEATTAQTKALYSEKQTIGLLHPVAKRPFECIVAALSLLPVLAYYLHTDGRALNSGPSYAKLDPARTSLARTGARI